jgi:hypothetical protein
VLLTTCMTVRAAGSATASSSSRDLLRRTLWRPHVAWGDAFELQAAVVTDGPVTAVHFARIRGVREARCVLVGDASGRLYIFNARAELLAEHATGTLVQSGAAVGLAMVAWRGEQASLCGMDRQLATSQTGTLTNGHEAMFWGLLTSGLENSLQTNLAAGVLLQMDLSALRHFIKCVAPDQLSPSVAAFRLRSSDSLDVVSLGQGHMHDGRYGACGWQRAHPRGAAGHFQVRLQHPSPQHEMRWRWRPPERSGVTPAGGKNHRGHRRSFLSR